MEVLNNILSWGSPLGVGVYILCLGSSAGIFFWEV